MPFNLPAIVADPERPLYIVEGAWNATYAQDAADEADTEATFTAVVNGANGWDFRYAVVLSRAGVKRATLIPDENEAGERFALKAAADLYAVGIKPVIVRLSSNELDPESMLDEGTDIVDWLHIYQSMQGYDARDLLVLLGEEVERAEAWTDGEDTTQEIDTMLNQEQPAYNWLVPDLFEYGDRLIITGGEGAGKSTMLRQMAMSIASGTNPYFPVRTFEPVPVLLVDLENSEAQTRRELRTVRAIVGDRLPPHTLFIEARGEGIDLMSDEGKQWLEKKVVRYLPNGGVFIVGPHYKLSSGISNDDHDAKVVSDHLDYLRMEYGLAIVMEAHTKHPSQQGRTVYRPFGSRHWVRWPEFGFHLDSSGIWTPWRDPRDAARALPSRFHRGNPAVGEWPWVGSMSAEDARYQRCLAVALDHWNPGEEIPRVGKVLRWLRESTAVALEAQELAFDEVAVESELQANFTRNKIDSLISGTKGAMRQEWDAAFHAVEREVAEAKESAEETRQDEGEAT